MVTTCDESAKKEIEVWEESRYGQSAVTRAQTHFELAS